MSEDLDQEAREAAYLDNITKRKQQKFASKVFGGLEAAREGGQPKPVYHTPVQTPVQTQPVHHQQPVKKTWNQPVESVHHEPINRSPVNHNQYSYGQIDTTSMISKRNDEDVEEALRKEEERMNKKLSSTAPVGSVVMGGLQHVSAQSPEKPKSQNFSPSYGQKSPQTSQTYSKPTPVHAQHYSGQSSSSCTCGTVCPQGTKFCPECGKSAITSSSTTFGYSQNNAPTGRYGEIDQTPMLSKRDDSDVEEALRREEERVNKKLGNTTGSAKFGGSQVTQPHHQPVHQPVHSPVHSPVHTRPYQISENVVEEVVRPIQNMNFGMKGAGVFCTYDVSGNPGAVDDRPKMSVDQSSSYLFTPVPGKLGVNIECLIEGSDVIKFKMTTTQNAVIVQKYSMPFPIGREHLKRKGDSVELDPF
jgi:hypothetical protein